VLCVSRLRLDPAEGYETPPGNPAEGRRSRKGAQALDPGVLPGAAQAPGQKEGLRATSTDRPVYPIIGVISCDGKHLAAIAWPETSKLGQVWHHCFHPRPVIGESFNSTTGKIKSHGRVYFLENDAKKLIARFKEDFPNWHRPPDAK
jgi:hypothetical protein